MSTQERRVVDVLLRAAREIGTAAARVPGGEEQLRWRRVATILATAAADVGCPGIFDLSPDEDTDRCDSPD